MPFKMVCHLSRDSSIWKQCVIKYCQLVWQSSFAPTSRKWNGWTRSIRFLTELLVHSQSFQVLWNCVMMISAVLVSKKLHIIYSEQWKANNHRCAEEQTLFSWVEVWSKKTINLVKIKLHANLNIVPWLPPVRFTTQLLRWPIIK